MYMSIDELLFNLFGVFYWPKQRSSGVSGFGGLNVISANDDDDR